MRRWSLSLLVCLLLAAPAQFRGTQAIQAVAAGAIYAVNTTNDTADADQGNPLCADATGHCSLRAAIMQANYTPGANTITVPSGIYLLTRVGDDDNAVLGDLDINDDVTIQGAGPGATIVDGNGTVTHDRVFQILSSATNVSLSGLTIQSGVVTTTFAEGGGLLWNGSGSGHLNLSHLVIQGNKAYDSGGVALHFAPGGDTANLDDVTIRANTATAAVGGLDVSLGTNFDTFVLRNSRVYSNTAYEGGGLYFDGDIHLAGGVRLEADDIYSNTSGLSAGIENRAGFGTNPLLILNSRLHDNHASFYGGGIGNYGQLTISNTTLAANLANLAGGGVYNYEGGQFNVTQSTLSGNSAQTGGGFYSELFVHNSSMVTVTNSTVSDNNASRDGAGLYLDGGRESLYNATITDNQVQVPITTSYNGLGGGLYLTHTAIMQFQNTLIASNTHSYQGLSPVPDDCFGPVDSLGYNLMGTVTNCPISGDTLDFYIGYNPLLGPLAYNGGPTQTRAPGIGSVAIDTAQVVTPGCTAAGNAPLTTDQRGYARPHGPHCDIGAVEFYPPGPFLPFIRR